MPDATHDARMCAIAVNAGPENKTCRLFKAARTNILGVRRKLSTCRAAARFRLPSSPYGLRCDERTPCADTVYASDGTCGRWTPTLARESRHIVAFLLSGTTSRAAVLTSLEFRLFGVHVRARLSRPARVKGFCPRDFSRLASQRVPRAGGSVTRREECDDGIDLVRRSRRAAEETLGGRTFGQPDRRGTRKCDAERSDRQGASARPVRPRQEPCPSAAPRQRKARPRRST